MEWHLLPKTPESFLEQHNNYPPLITQLLYNRGLKEKEEIEKFLNPDFNQGIYNPFFMKGAKEAVEKISQTILDGKKICIYGDYDADGVCGALILQKTFEVLGASKVDIYIPDRAKEGYGLNLPAIHEIKKNKIDLIVTVDCGISNFKEAELIKKLEIDLVITDHHQIVDNKIPLADAIINPHQNSDEYPFKNLAGAGVAYKLACGLIQEKNIEEGFEKWLLDLVALATVADSMPLVDENRILTKFGLVVLNKTKRAGLKELIRQSGLDFKNIGVYEIAFMLAPRLNAAGRMDHANMAYELLNTESAEEAKWLSERLCGLNQERQNLVEKFIQEVALRHKDTGLPKIIFDGGENWPVGILGLIAGRLSEKYNRPAIIFSSDGFDIKGSSRSESYFDFNLVEVYAHCKKLLTRFGGHPQAAGFSLPVKNLEDFKQCVMFQAEKIDENKLVKIINVDAEISGAEINWENYNYLEKLSPFGKGNEKPVFLIKGMGLKEMKSVGSGNKHKKLILQDKNSGKSFKAIAFNFKSEIAKLNISDTIEVVCEIIKNEWNGFKDLELKIIDFKKTI